MCQIYNLAYPHFSIHLSNHHHFHLFSVLQLPLHNHHHHLSSLAVMLCSWGWYNDTCLDSCFFLLLHSSAGTYLCCHCYDHCCHHLPPSHWREQTCWYLPAVRNGGIVTLFYINTSILIRTRKEGPESLRGGWYLALSSPLPPSQKMYVPLQNKI